MKINYSILWLDDNINAFIDDGWIENINQYLINEGFEPNIVPVAKIDDFDSKLDDSFDLILTDYHLIGKNGDEVVIDIRNKNIQTEILFYTARGDLQDIGKTDRITFLQTTGVGDHYSEVVDEIKELISLTIKKFQHIIAMRGMIMHETSTLDNQTLQIIKSYMESKKIDKNNIIDSICKKLENLLNSKQNIVKNAKDKRKYKDLFKDTFLFSAEYKIEVLKHVIEKLALTDFTDEYKKEISNMRNKFAHAILETDEDGRQYFKSGDDGITYNEALCKKMRININKHKKNIDELENKTYEFLRG